MVLKLDQIQGLNFEKVMVYFSFVSGVQAAKMVFLRRISGLTLLDKVRSSDVHESLDIKSLLF